VKKKLKCILMVDDDEPTCFYNKLVVEQSGCAEKVVTAQSGRQALEYLNNCIEDNSNYPCPDLIFLDINMPAMNGWEFLEQYKNLQSHKKGKVMIIMLTTSLFPEDQQKASEIPEISGFEHKPLNGKKLLQVLEAHFG
jgi:CheY-like chemotaxis protein